MTRIGLLMVYNQLDARQEFDYVNNAQNNCGPACVATALRYTIGGVQRLDAIKDAMRGEFYKGYTSTYDLTRYMMTQGIPSHTEYITTAADLRALCKRQVDQARPTILLFRFDLALNEGGHFVVLEGYDNEGIWVLNPYGRSNGWSGFTHRFTWAQAWVNYKLVNGSGWAVAVDKGYRQGYRPYKENWCADVVPGRVNVRPEPNLSAPPLTQVQGGSYKFTVYTDGGDTVGNITRWHRRAQGGWIHGSLLQNWRRP